MSSEKSIFARNAEKFHQLGLAVIPCGKDSGKQPLVKWRGITRKRVSDRTMEKWIKQFPEANIGILLGEASGIVVLDDDANRNPEEIFREFGYTPIYVRTPSKGGHYYYRLNGEVSTNIGSRKLEIKSTGTIVIAPPSVSPKNGRAYEFLGAGFGIDFIEDLPTIKSEALEALAKETPLELKDIIPEGKRNAALFDFLRSVAYQYREEQSLYEAASEFNSKKTEKPLKDNEVRKTVKSVWGYRLSGNLIVPGEQYASTALKDIVELTPEELWLLSLLKANHNGLRPEFVLCIPALMRKYGYTRYKIQRARDGLICKGFIRQTHYGGKGVGDPNKFEFTPRV